MMLNLLKDAIMFIVVYNKVPAEFGEIELTILLMSFCQGRRRVGMRTGRPRPGLLIWAVQGHPIRVSVTPVPGASADRQIQRAIS